MLKELFEDVARGWVQAKQEQFTGNPFANNFRKNVKQEIRQIVAEFDDSYIVKASVGNSKWADVAWVSILDPEITQTTQDGVYPVYLVKADGSRTTMWTLPSILFSLF